MENEDTSELEDFQIGEPDSPSVPTSDDLTWGDKMLVPGRELSPRHRKLAELSAMGKSNREIAKLLDYTESRVSILLSNTQIKLEIDRIRERIYEETIGGRLKKMAEPALNEIEKCLRDETNKYRANLKVDTAKWVVEKLDGKAVQKYDVGENMLGILMDRLDAIKSAGQPIEVLEISSDSVSTQDLLEPAFSGQPSSPPEPPKTVDQSEEEDLADWVTHFKP